MKRSVQQMKIVFLSTFPPEKCSSASFTQDLINAIKLEPTEETDIEVCALDKSLNARLYNAPVSIVRDGHQSDKCLETAIAINKDTSIKLICIKHEFGLYSGVMGEYLLGFLAMLEKPFVIRFHTVLPHPVAKMLRIVQSIASLAEKVIVMTENAARIIREEYSISADKVTVIPHGTRASSSIDTNILKTKYNLRDRQVFTTFGLLGPNKGIEKGILAMKEISVAFPDAMYVVLGQTHPNLLEQEGEKYRDYTQQLPAVYIN